MQGLGHGCMLSIERVTPSYGFSAEALTPISSLLVGSSHRSGFTDACSWWISMCNGTDAFTWSPALTRGSVAFAYSMLARTVEPFLMRFPWSSKSSLTNLHRSGPSKPPTAAPAADVYFSAALCVSLCGSHRFCIGHLGVQHAGWSEGPRLMHLRSSLVGVMYRSLTQRYTTAPHVQHMCASGQDLLAILPGGIAVHLEDSVAVLMLERT